MLLAYYKLQEQTLSKLIKDNERETLKSLIQLVIGKKIKNLKTTIGISTFKGWVLPNISVDASNSLLENNEPLHLHLDGKKLKQVSSVIGKNLNARWMKVDNNFSINQWIKIQKFNILLNKKHFL